MTRIPIPYALIDGKKQESIQEGKDSIKSIALEKREDSLSKTDLMKRSVTMTVLEIIGVLFVAIFFFTDFIARPLAILGWLPNWGSLLMFILAIITLIVLISWWYQERHKK